MFRVMLNPLRSIEAIRSPKLQRREIARKRTIRPINPPPKIRNFHLIYAVGAVNEEGKRESEMDKNSISKRRMINREGKGERSYLGR